MMRVYCYSYDLSPFNNFYLGYDLKEGTFQELNQKLRVAFEDIEHISDEYTVNKYGAKDWIDQLKKPYVFKEIRAWSNYEYGLYYEATRRSYTKPQRTYHPCTNVVVFEEMGRITLLPDKKTGKLIPFNSPENAEKIGVPWNSELLTIIKNRKKKDFISKKATKAAYRTWQNTGFSTSYVNYNPNGSVKNIEFN